MFLVFHLNWQWFVRYSNQNRILQYPFREWIRFIEFNSINSDKGDNQKSANVKKRIEFEIEYMTHWVSAKKRDKLGDSKNFKYSKNCQVNFVYPIHLMNIPGENLAGSHEIVYFIWKVVLKNKICWKLIEPHSHTRKQWHRGLHRISLRFIENPSLVLDF